MVSLLLSNGSEPERRDRAMHDSALQWFDNGCRHTPDRIAAVDWYRGLRLTYRTLHRRAERLAAALQSSGIALGDRVAVLLHNQTEMREALLGCAMIGAIAVPLNWRLSVTELHGIMLDCEPKLMVYDADEPELSRLAAGLPLADSALLSVAALESSTDCAAVRRHHPVHGDAWMMIYTGGTTGKPKGVVLTPGYVYWNAVNTVVSWQLTADDVTRAFLSGGAPCPLTVYQAFQAKVLPFKEGYGATESGPNNFVIDPAIAAQKPGSVGLPMMFSEAKLIPLPGDSAQPERDQVGVLALRGGHLFSHYWNNPEATAAALREGWFVTGDLASRDKDGYYYIVGRKKDMIITGGENVYPLEVEQTLESFPGVKEAAVVGVPDDKWGEVVAAVVAVHEGAAVTEAGLAAFCSARIGKYKVPKRFLFVRELPTTAVGKLDKKRMREWFGG
ncbi:AMP-binding protein [Paenibacillus melissococcoides]|uniref:AMP-binding protein n=1 Tax=Paenibacillus melissococcoides TaxID=2912268 RepID=A0ABN8U1P3_9BACL|nr:MULTISPECIES: AMP-binding protein [Paenibacillus]MEB9894773.1 AMP-binding protein [Bacillus cereus]CAH8243153.1 AMP-binding protein [Paenibacillus melissococcoides]CAH8703856.1 AMP-binding protein [Paenibacillus melissococcoides]CAH8706939.1 AMP-binding protein [Paenibacillus melissococcoides]GIO77230.1 hypothetical protein J6TS7_08400 [Paenibacillus dendritiformis]